MINYRWIWNGSEWINQFGETWPVWLAAREAFFASFGKSN